MMRTLIVMMCFLFACIGCGKKSEPKPPEAVQLIFPDRNSECTTGESLSANSSQVEFSWSPADHTESYELRVTNSNTGAVQTMVTTSTSARLPLAKGQPFSWLVSSRNNQVERSVPSEVWHFYNSGPITTFAPFPATIIRPASSQNVFKDINNEVTLSWSVSDLDNDIDRIEIYFSVETSPSDLVETVSPNTTSLKVTVSSNTVYYWRVAVFDAAGNTSNSGVYNFKVN